MLILGIYLPTSINSVTSNVFLMASLFILNVSLLLIARKQRKINVWFVVIGLAINAIPWLFTLFSPFDNYAFGTSVYYLSLAILFIVKLEDLKITKMSDKVFTIINAVNIGLGFFMVLKVSIVNRLIILLYSDFHNDLVRLMISFHKPILTFTTHYIASVFFYLFFFICFKSYKYRNRRIDLVFSVGYLALLFYLNSNASIFFLVVGSVQLLFYFFRHKPIVFYSISSFILIVAMVLYEKTLALITNAFEQVSRILLSQNNGLVGRYSSDGILKGNIDFIANNPFNPIGYGYTDEMFFGDSGIVLNLLRGSLVLVILVYVALYMFLRRNLNSSKSANLIFGVLLLSELGFPITMYFRTLFILPFVIVYLNYLEMNWGTVQNYKLKDIKGANPMRLFKKEVS